MPTKVKEGEVVVTLAMPEELRHQLKQIALDNRTTLAATVQEALEQHVARVKSKRRWTPVSREIGAPSQTIASSPPHRRPSKRRAGAALRRTRRAQ